MLVKNILSALSLALVASANPMLEGRGGCGSSCKGSDVQRHCRSDENACCCDLVDIDIGIGCGLLDLDVLISAQCSTGKTCCCKKNDALIDICLVVNL